ncbi:MAG: tetratricopeptide repeat protein, partial [Myxococcota bacterium]
MALLWAGLAPAQSPALLEAIRVHEPEVRAKAEAEWEACRATKGCRELSQLSLLTGYLALSEGDAAAAVKLLSAAKPPRGLEAFHAWYLGEALSYDGQPAAAVKRLAQAKKGPAWLARRADVRLAEVYLALGQAAKARPLLESAAAVDPTPELLLARALAREGTRDVTKALQDFTAIALRFPAHPHARVAEAHRQALGARDFTAAEHLFRAQAWLAAGKPERCLEELRQVDGDASLDPARVALVRAQALLTRGKEKDDEALAQLAVAEKGSPAVAAEALNTKARRLMRVGDNGAAREAFRALDLRFPDDALADEAGYLAAWLAMNSGDDATAVKDFAAFEELHPRSKKRDEARWFRSYALIRLGRHAEARELLLTLASDFPKSSLVPQANYWAARAAQLG